MNPLRLDPTRTTTLRRKFIGDLNARFNVLKKELRKLLIEDDAFGLKQPKPSVLFNARVNNPKGCNQHTGPNCVYIKAEDLVPTDRDYPNVPEEGWRGYLSKMPIAKQYARRWRAGSEPPAITIEGYRKVGEKSRPKIVSGHKRALAGLILGKPVPVDTSNLTEKDLERLREIIQSVGPDLTDNWTDEARAKSLESRRRKAAMKSKPRVPLLPARFGPDYKPPLEEQLDTLHEGLAIDKLANLDNSFNYDNLSDKPNVVSLGHSNPYHNRWGHFVQIVTDGKDYGVELLDCKNRPIQGTFGVSKEQAVRAYVETSKKLANSGPLVRNWSDEARRKSLDNSKPITNELVFNTGEWRYLTDERKLEALKKWLQFRVGALFLKREQDDSAQSWLGAYIKQAHQQGLKRAWNSWKRPTGPLPMSKEAGIGYQQGQFAEFMRQSFGGPTPLERVRLLATRTYDDLQGVTESMSHSITRTLLDGVVSGINPRDIGAQLNTIVDGYKNRGTAIARTEVVRAFNEGALDGYENMGVKAIGVQVEWTVSGLGHTALGNPSPCHKCAPLAGLVLTVEEARGLLPRHPNCMCSLIPANVGEKTTGQIRDAERIRKAIKASAAGDKRWLGAKKKISSKRPEVVTI